MRGTLIAELVLAVAVAGLLQMAAQFYIEPMFNGLMLVLAAGLAGLAARQRASSVHRCASPRRSIDDSAK